jgi:hypothetical protein
MRFDSSVVCRGGGRRAQILKGEVRRSINDTYLGLLKVMNFVKLPFEQIGEFPLICGIPIMRGGASLERTM